MTPEPINLTQLRAEIASNRYGLLDALASQPGTLGLSDDARAKRQLAALHLTPAEFAAWELADRHLSQRATALALGISRSAVQSRLENARRKIAAAQRKDEA